MATKGPIAGIRVPVQLPYSKDINVIRNKVAKKEKPFVALKLPVAKFLSFTVSDIPTYETNNPGKKTGSEKTTRLAKGGYKAKSMKLVFKKSQNIGGKSVKSISIPLPKGTQVADAYAYFNGKAKGLSLQKMVSPDGRSFSFTKV